MEWEISVAACRSLGAVYANVLLVTVVLFVVAFSISSCLLILYGVYIGCVLIECLYSKAEPNVAFRTHRPMLLSTSSSPTASPTASLLSAAQGVQLENRDISETAPFNSLRCLFVLTIPIYSPGLRRLFPPFPRPRERASNHIHVDPE